MKRFSEQFHKQAEDVKLHSAEKRELRERLISYMEYHPLPAEMRAAKPTFNNKTEKTQVLNDAFATFSIPFGTLFKTSAVAAAIILMILPFAAEKAVPGDALYAIKVQFNEELRSTLTFDSYQKVEWETERLNRRIAEARLLASEGRLTEEVEAEVAAAVKVHTDNAKREIEELRTQDADEAAIASIALDTTLQVQSTSLRGDKLATMTDGQVVDSTDQATNLIANVIDESRSQTEAEGVPVAPPSYDKLMARVEMNTTRIYEYRDTIKKTVPEKELTDVNRRIDDIERSVQEAIELSASDNDSARLQLVNVLQRTQKLIVYMTELEVTQTVDIETLVPVVLTDEEVDQFIKTQIEELDLKVLKINELVASVEDENILEKVDSSLQSLSELSDKMASSTEDFTVFQLTANEAQALADDTIELLEKHLDPTDEPVNLSEIDVEIEDNATSTVEEMIEDVTGSSTDEIIIITETGTSSTTTVDSN